MTTEMSPTAELLQKAGRRPPSRTAIIAMALAGAMAFGGIGFGIGRFTAPAPTFAGFPGGNGGNGGVGGNGFPGLGGGAGGGFRGGGLEGTVQSISGDTMTLKTANGSTLTVNLSSSTTYGKQIAAQQGDTATGSTVRIGLSFQAGQNPGSGTGSGTVNASSVTLITP
jgi:hypothetical protein